MTPAAAKRVAQREARAACVVAVSDRQRGKCAANRLEIEGVDCWQWMDEVHELGRGQWRKHCLTVPEACIGLCRPCHRWVTEHPEAAYDLGLAWGPDSEQKLRELGLLRPLPKSWKVRTP